MRDENKTYGVLFEGEDGRIFINRDHLTGKPVEDLTKAECAWLETEADKLSGGRHLPAAEGEAWPQRLPRPELHLPQPHAELFRLRQVEEAAGLDIFQPPSSDECLPHVHDRYQVEAKAHMDPLKEEFVGDAEANAMLKRPQRSPYEIKA